MKSSSLVSIVFCAFTKMFAANDLQHELIYCLAFVKSAELNIIGRKSSLQAMLVGRSIYDVFHGMCIEEAISLFCTWELYASVIWKVETKLKLILP